MMTCPLGKWCQVEYERVDHLVVVPLSVEEKPSVAMVIAAGPMCSEAITTREPPRILFEPGAAKEFTVGGEKIVLVHEDHILAVLP